MNPKENRYTQEHEWIWPQPNGQAKIGITDYAQSQLGDIVFLDLPEPGTEVSQSSKIGEIESVKAVSELYSPASGIVLEVNQEAIEAPGLVNEDAYGRGWLILIEMSNNAELEKLMNSDEYDGVVAALIEENNQE